MTRADDAGDGRVFDIEITYFQDDRIWLATSDDIKGLTVEADSFQTFLETLVDVSADLLAANHGLREEELDDTTLRVKRVVVDQDGASPAQRAKRRRHTPKLMLDDPVGLVAAAA